MFTRKIIQSVRTSKIFLIYENKNLFIDNISSLKLSHRYNSKILKNKTEIKSKNFNSIVQFSTTAKRNAISPILWLFVKPITKLSSILFGRFYI